MNALRAFTLIELMVVIAIIGLLSSVVLASLSTAREKAQIVKAQAELRTIYTAIQFLDDDTGLWPGGFASGKCYAGATGPEGNGLRLSSADAGLINYTVSKFPGWHGPYLPSNILDPWGHEYIYDSFYACSGGSTDCTGSGTYTVIHSGGPNGSGPNSYDSDNITTVLCAH